MELLKKRETLKYIAILLMLEDHIVQTFMPHGTFVYNILDALSHFTFVTMSYFLVEGFKYTRSRSKYLKRMLIFAVISQLPFMLTFTDEGIIGLTGLNIFFTLSFCFIMIWGLDSLKNNFLKVLLVLSIIGICCFCDWTFLAPIITLFFYWARDNKKKQLIAYIATTIIFGSFITFVYYGVESIGEGIVAFLINISGIVLSAVCVLGFYDGSQIGKHKLFNKYFFYVFYPAHLLIIGLIRIALMYKG